MAQTFTKIMSRFVPYVNRPIYNNLKINRHYNQKHIGNSNFVMSKRRKSNICWKCGKERGNTFPVFCEKCNVIQQPHETENFFKVFGIEEKFNVDQQHLKNKFRRLQSLLHPDKFSNKTDEEQTISADYSSLLNKAYNNLQVPLKRAEHLLKLKGEEISEIGENQPVDPQFLMEMMLLNEEVEEAGNNVVKLKQLNAKNNAELEKISKEIDNCFKNNDIQTAKMQIIKLKYFNSISNRINKMLRELGETE